MPSGAEAALNKYNLDQNRDQQFFQSCNCISRFRRSPQKFTIANENFAQKSTGPRWSTNFKTCNFESSRIVIMQLLLKWTVVASNQTHKGLIMPRTPNLGSKSRHANPQNRPAHIYSGPTLGVPVHENGWDAYSNSPINESKK